MDSFIERRDSFKANLKKGNFERAKKKIDDNLELVEANVKELQSNLFKLGSKNDNQNLTDKTNKIILKTGEIFTETYNFINDFMSYKYASKQDKIDNNRKARSFEDSCNKSKSKFDDIVKKIQRQDKALVESARNSIRLSNLRQDSFSQSNNNMQIKVFDLNGNNILDNEIEQRNEQIDLITEYL